MLDASQGIASFDQRVATGFPVLKGSRTYAYKQQFLLPLTWTEFAKAYSNVITQHSEQAQTELFKEFDDRLFPKGSGTEAVLYETVAEFMPHIVAQHADNTWSAVVSDYQQANLPGDGFVRVAAAINNSLSLLRLHRSDNAAGDAFYSNSKAFMDSALKGLNIVRTVGPDNVRVTSLGKALTDKIYIDHYGRKWQQRIWPLPYLDAYIVGMLLPTPDGYSALLQFAPAQALDEFKAQSMALVDYVDVSYWGTIAQWQSYLKRSTLLPSSMAEVQLDVGNALTLHTHRFVFSVPAEVLQVTQDSELGVGMSFMRDAQRTVWDIGGAWLYADAQKKSYVEFWRQPQPPTTAKLELRNKFTNLRNRRSPYDMESSRETDDTYAMSSALDAPGKTAATISTDLVYAMTLALAGTPTSTELLAKEKMLLKSSQVLEQGAASEPAERPVATAVANNDAYSDANDLYKEAVKTLIESSEAVNEESGEDIRGRTFSQDVREYLVPLLSTRASDEQSQNAIEVSRRAQALKNYWRLMKRFNSARQLWPTFLEYNHLPIDSKRDSEVGVQESILKAMLISPPSDQWATQLKLMIDVYLEERCIVFNHSARLKDVAYIARQSVCPQPSKQTSGKSKPRISPDSVIPDYYPPGSDLRQEQGLVLLSVRISATGCATEAAVVGSSGSKDLDAGALKLAASMQFLPAEKDGTAVTSEVILPINFKLNYF